MTKEKENKDVWLETKDEGSNLHGWIGKSGVNSLRIIR